MKYKITSKMTNIFKIVSKFIEKYIPEETLFYQVNIY